MTTDFTIILPAKNEAENLPTLLQEIDQALASEQAEIIVIDDGSTDDTYAVTTSTAATLRLPVRQIRHERSLGQSTSVFEGMLAAAGKWVITLDADGQNDPADIPALISRARQMTAPHYCIIGHRQQRKDTAWKRFQSRVANNVRQFILNDNTPDTGCGLKILPVATCRLLPYFDHMHRYTPALVKRLGGFTESVAVNHRPRMAGVSKYNAWNRGWAGLIDMLGVRWLMYRSRLSQHACNDFAQTTHAKADS